MSAIQLGGYGDLASGFLLIVLAAYGAYGIIRFVGNCFRY